MDSTYTILYGLHVNDIKNIFSFQNIWCSLIALKTTNRKLCALVGVILILFYSDDLYDLYKKFQVASIHNTNVECQI